MADDTLVQQGIASIQQGLALLQQAVTPPPAAKTIGPGTVQAILHANYPGMAGMSIVADKVFFVEDALNPDGSERVDVLNISYGSGSYKPGEDAIPAGANQPAVAATPGTLTVGQHCSITYVPKGAGYGLDLFVSVAAA